VATEWAAFCGAKDFTRDGSDIVVGFGDGRSQRVSVAEEAGAYVLSSFVARRETVVAISDLALRVWTRNRAVALVGFRMDTRERLVGEAWIPSVGLTAEEFQLYVRTVAAECDRLEYILTGRDKE
jgi:hypothetical protein